jgi:hypothetical protein
MSAAEAEPAFVMCPWCHGPVIEGVVCDKVFRGWQGCLRSYRCEPCGARITVSATPVFVGSR